MSSALSHIAAVVAGLALVMTSVIVFPENYIRSLTKSLAFSMMLVVLAAVLIRAARHLGS